MSGVCLKCVWSVGFQVCASGLGIRFGYQGLGVGIRLGYRLWASGLGIRVGFWGIRLGLGYEGVGIRFGFQVWVRVLGLMWVSIRVMYQGLCVGIRV